MKTGSDLKRRCPDTNKLERLVGWKPKVNFEEGLKRTIKWFVPKKTQLIDRAGKTEKYA